MTENFDICGFTLPDRENVEYAVWTIDDWTQNGVEFTLNKVTETWSAIAFVWDYEKHGWANNPTSIPANEATEMARELRLGTSYGRDRKQPALQAGINC